MDEVVKRIVGAAYRVSDALGSGFLEKVYQRAMTFELAQQGLAVRSQLAYTVFERGMNVPDYTADLVVEDQVVVELKCVDSFANEHIAQCI